MLSSLLWSGREELGHTYPVAVAVFDEHDNSFKPLRALRFQRGTISPPRTPHTLQGQQEPADGVRPIEMALGQLLAMVTRLRRSTSHASGH